jgi:hypothetical protein
MKTRKAQLSSIDIIISVLAIMLFISIVIVYFNTINSSNDSGRMYRTALLELSPLLDGYAINETELTILKAPSTTPDIIRTKLLAPVGLDESNYDVCVILKKGSDYVRLLDGATAITGSCEPARDACAQHRKVTAHTKPVVYQEKLWEMSMLVCEK